MAEMVCSKCGQEIQLFRPKGYAHMHGTDWELTDRLRCYECATPAEPKEEVEP
jgi:DNA-directed RNA polymerase subunit RPC12/RpoP